MFKKMPLVSFFVSLAIAGLIGIAFYLQLNSFSRVVRISCAGSVMVMIFIAAWVMRSSLQELGRFKYWLLGGLALFVALWFTMFSVAFGTLDYAEISYSNGTQQKMVAPSQFNAWGRQAQGFDMHPAYGNAVVPDALSATFSSTPKRVVLALAKPQFALYSANGKPTNSDGVSVEIRAFDSSGAVGYEANVVVSQSDFLKNKWVDKTIVIDSGIARIDVKLGWGGVGSTPDYDSTIVVFETINWYPYATFIGTMVLGCFSFFTILIFISLNLASSGNMTVRQWWIRNNRVVLFVGVFAICLLGYTYWTGSETSYVFFWDYRNYWQKTEAFYELIEQGAFGQAINAFVNSYSSDYSMLPSVLPALLSQVTGYPTRLNYLLTITALYAAPAYLLITYLAKKIIDGGDTKISTTAKFGWVFASFCVLLGLPFYHGTTLLMMPDIGGVVLFVCALLNATTITTIIRDGDSGETSWLPSKHLVRSSITLGVVFSVMCVFRRWYVFAVVGIACSLLIVFLYDLLRGRSNRLQMISRAAVSAVLMASAMLSLLCWILFSWSRDLGKHDYSNLYSSYKFSLAHDGQLLLNWIGPVELAVCLIGGIALCFLAKTRQLLFMVIFSSLLACVLFLSVQSPGRHHLYLLMPLLGVCMAGLFIVIARRLGVMVSLFLAMLLALGGVMATPPLNGWSGSKLFASYQDLLPREQKYKDGFIQVANWLETSGNSDKKFCVIASGQVINQSVFAELWQLIPNVAKNAYDSKMVQLGQVDSVNGPPLPIVRECQIFLVAVPFQAHLAPNEQFTLGIIQQDLINGTGIGLTVDRSPKVFVMGDNIEILGYQSSRMITDEEYADLVHRFKESKRVTR